MSKRNPITDELSLRELIGSFNDIDVMDIILVKLCKDDEQDEQLKEILIDFHEKLVDFFLSYEIEKNGKGL